MIAEKKKKILEWGVKQEAEKTLKGYGSTRKFGFGNELPEERTFEQNRMEIIETNIKNKNIE